MTPFDLHGKPVRRKTKAQEVKGFPKVIQLVSSQAGFANVASHSD